MEVQIRIAERRMSPQKLGQSLCSLLKVTFSPIRIVFFFFFIRELNTQKKRTFVSLLSKSSHFIWQ